MLVLEPDQSGATITQQAPGIRVVVGGGELVESVPSQPERGMSPELGELAGTRRDARSTQQRHHHTHRARRVRAEVMPGGATLRTI